MGATDPDELVYFTAKENQEEIVEKGANLTLALQGAVEEGNERCYP